MTKVRRIWLPIPWVKYSIRHLCYKLGFFAVYYNGTEARVDTFPKDGLVRL